MFYCASSIRMCFAMEETDLFLLYSLIKSIKTCFILACNNCIKAIEWSWLTLAEMCIFCNGKLDEIVKIHLNPLVSCPIFFHLRYTEPFFSLHFTFWLKILAWALFTCYIEVLFLGAIISVECNKNDKACGFCHLWQQLILSQFTGLW